MIPKICTAISSRSNGTTLWRAGSHGRSPLGDPSHGNFLQGPTESNTRFNNADKDTYDIPDQDLSSPGFTPQDFFSIPTDAIFNTQLSNRFRNTFSTQELRLGYKKIHSKYNLEAGLVLSPSSSESNDLIDQTRNVPVHWVWNVAPFARFRYKFSKTSSIRGRLPRQHLLSLHIQAAARGRCVGSPQHYRW